MVFTAFPVIGNKLWTTCMASLKVFQAYEWVVCFALLATYSPCVPQHNNKKIIQWACGMLTFYQFFLYIHPDINIYK